MILKGALRGFRVVEVPVSYHPRIGKSKISGTLKGTRGRGLVHSQLDRALLFPASNGPEKQAQLRSPSDILWSLQARQCVPQPMIVCWSSWQRLRGRCSQDASNSGLSAESVTDFYRCLLEDTLDWRGHWRCGSCHNVSGGGRERVGAAGGRGCEGGRAAGRRPCCRAHIGFCTFFERSEATHVCVQQR